MANATAGRNVSAAAMPETALPSGQKVRKFGAESNCQLAQSVR